MLGEPYVVLPPPSSPRECLSVRRRAAGPSSGRRPLKRRDPNSSDSESIGLNASRPECSASSPLTKSRPAKGEPDQNNLTPFGHAKRLFHRSAQVRIVGRTAERALIEKFWREATENMMTVIAGCDVPKPRVLYVCGNPGTGKTALINEMLPELLLQQTQTQMLQNHRLIKTNCMMHHDPREVLNVIARQLGVALSKKSETASHDRWTELANRIQSSLERTARRPKGGLWTTLVLDEVDQIAIKDAPLLQQIFAWPTQTSANMIIIGIANALDLSIRYCSAPPEQVSILNFTPYSPEDISRILMARMELANEALLHQQENDNAPSDSSRPSLISPQAVEICARKVSAVGDLRQALEIMREAISLAESQDDTPHGRVEIPHVMRAIERAFGSAVRTTSRHAQLIGELNLHQKLLLATLHRLVRDSANLKPTIHSLYDSYAANVRLHRIIDAVGRSEFNDLVANSESMGVISLIAPGRRKASRGGSGTGGGDTASLLPDTKVLLALPLEDVATGLCSNPILQQLL